MAAGRDPIQTWARGSWSWFGDPRAVHVGGPAGLTFAGWIDWAGDVTVGAFDPRFGALSDAVVGHAYHDDHSDPSLLVEPDGRLTVFWSGHNGVRMYVRSTVHPGDITSWAPVAQVHQDIPGSRRLHLPQSRPAARRAPPPLPVLPRGRLERGLRPAHAAWRVEPLPRGHPGTRSAAVPQGRRGRPRHHRSGLHRRSSAQHADQRLVRGVSQGLAVDRIRSADRSPGRSADRAPPRACRL